ncbi:winged helix-turn-helix domain-containing protein [bacterium]|nr:winged helix-turn-helix domain-containing protein [bacterium]
MDFSEWLRLVGFRDNPFASKQASEEQELLQACFVEHPTYKALIEGALAYTSILHAPRGAGKSTTCLMLEDYYTRRHAELRPLIVQFKDWHPFITVMRAEPEPRLHAYITELLRQIVAALGRQAQVAAWLQPPTDPIQHSTLIWLCQTYGSYLLPQQRMALRESGLLPDLPAHASTVAALRGLPPHKLLDAVVTAIQAAGVGQCLVFIDRVDETEYSMRDPTAASQLVAPLLSNQAFLEMPGIAYKFFLPTELVGVLHAQRLFRADRVRTYALHWDGPNGDMLLREMLKARLEAFSDPVVTSLDALAVPELRGQIDTALIATGRGSPRLLLIAGDLLLQACITDLDTSPDNFLIQPTHLERMRNQIPDIAASLQLGESLPLGPPSPTVTPEQPDPEPPADVDVPLLSIELDGSVCRGGQPIAGWERLTKRQRAVLTYLYERPDQMISTEQLIQEVWRTFLKNTDDIHVVTEDAVRKMLDSLSKLLEPDVSKPVYIQKYRGGLYCLRYAASARTPSSQE